jgi:uridine phosphorylase
MSDRQPHILATPEDLTPFALLPGDPARVLTVARHLENAREVARNREYLIVTGIYHGTPVTVMSTGMGGVSVGIGVEELTPCGVRYGIRIGSAGALQTGIRLGDIIIAEGAVRDEGTTRAYVPLSMPAIADPTVYRALIDAAALRQVPHWSGIVRSHDSFYRDDEEAVSQSWSKRGVLASEMEAAALFIVGRHRGMKTGAVLNTVVEWGSDTAQGIQSLVDSEGLRKQGEENEILVALDALYRLHQKETERSK